MKNTVAEFIRRAAFVDANALLKDVCGVGYREPSQAWYYALFKDRDDVKASIKSREEWSDDYILGFFEGLTARPRILGLLDGLKYYKKEKNGD